MRKTLTVLFLFFLTNIICIALYSCRKTDAGVKTNAFTEPCGPFPDSRRCAILKKISVQPFDNKGKQLSVNDTIPHDKLVLRVTLHAEETICRRLNVHPFITSSYACSPNPPSTDFKGTIDRISIFCKEDFDAHHPSGADLRPFFDMPAYVNVNTYRRSGNGIDGETDIPLMHRPQKPGEYNFTVVFNMVDGTTVSGVCLPVNLSW